MGSQDHDMSLLYIFLPGRNNYIQNRFWAYFQELPNGLRISRRRGMPQKTASNTARSRAPKVVGLHARVGRRGGANLFYFM